MKIVSLQSVGLGAAYTRGDGEQIITPYGIYVGATFLYSAGNYSDATVTEINYQQGDFDAYGFEIYTVHTSDGHIRVLPADKYAQKSINWTIFIQLLRQHLRYDCDYKN